MALDIAVTSQNVAGNEDRRWLGSRMGADQCRSVTLDVSMFTANHFTAKGAIPSGIAIAKITGTGAGGVVGKYGPYDDGATDGRQVCAGLLFNTTHVGIPGVGNQGGADKATAADVGAPLYWGPGIIKTAFLPVFGGGETTGIVDAAAKADMTHVRFE